MTVMAVAPGLRDAVTIEGYSFALPPTDVQAKPQFLESVDYFIDTSAHVDRPLTWSDERLGIASPDVARKWQLSLQWDQLPRRDYVALQTILALPGPLDVCLWRPIVETFTMDGVKRICTLSAMPAVIENRWATPISAISTPLVAHPPEGYRFYQAQVYVSGALQAYSYPGWASGPDSLGRFPVGIPGDPNVAVLAEGTVVEIYYVPVYRCRRAGAECTFPVAQRETLGLSLEQLG